MEDSNINAPDQTVENMESIPNSPKINGSKMSTEQSPT